MSMMGLAITPGTAVDPIWSTLRAAAPMASTIWARSRQNRPGQRALVRDQPNVAFLRATDQPNLMRHVVIMQVSRRARIPMRCGLAACGDRGGVLGRGAIR